jgi:hypothetical protein
MQEQAFLDVVSWQTADPTSMLRKLRQETPRLPVELWIIDSEIAPVDLYAYLHARGSQWCRFQYSLSFISALMVREGNRQLPTRHLSGQKLNCRSLCGFRTPRMATSTIDKTHACDNHS